MPVTDGVEVCDRDLRLDLAPYDIVRPFLGRWPMPLEVDIIVVCLRASSVST